MQEALPKANPVGVTRDLDKYFDRSTRISNDEYASKLPSAVAFWISPEHLARFHDFASGCQTAALSHSRVFSITKSISFCVSSANIGNEIQEAAFRSEFRIGSMMRADFPHGYPSC